MTPRSGPSQPARTAKLRPKREPFARAAKPNKFPIPLKVNAARANGWMRSADSCRANSQINKENGPCNLNVDCVCFPVTPTNLLSTGERSRTAENCRDQVACRIPKSSTLCLHLDTISLQRFRPQPAPGANWEIFRKHLYALLPRTAEQILN